LLLDPTAKRRPIFPRGEKIPGVHEPHASYFLRLWDSGVARVPCALGQEIFLRPPSTITAQFEVKYQFQFISFSRICKKDTSMLISQEIYVTYYDRKL